MNEVPATPPVFDEATSDSSEVPPRRSVLIIAATVAVLTMVALFVATRDSDLSSRLPPVDSAWQRVDGPSALLNLGSLVATPEGFAVVSGPGDGGSRLWFSRDGLLWVPDDMEATPLDLVVDGSDLLAFRGRRATRYSLGLTGWSATADVTLPVWVGVGYTSGRPGLIAANGGLLVQSIEGELYRSVDEGATFALAVAEGTWGHSGRLGNRMCAPPAAGSLDYPPIVATNSEFVALVTTRDDWPVGVSPVCEPEALVSTDGATWRPVAGSAGGRPGPFGEGGFVFDVAWRDGLFVAVGGYGPDDPAVWVSADAATWQRIDPGLSFAPGPVDLGSVEAGGAGWLIQGERTDRPGLVGWVSMDGSCWEPLPTHVQGGAAAVGTDRIVISTGPGSTDLWVGTAAIRSCQ